MEPVVHEQASAAAEAFGAEAGVVSAYIFGSVAEGRAHRESDVDLAVLLSLAVYPTRAARFDIRLRLMTRLQGAIGRDVDLVVLNDAPPQFARRIILDGRQILTRDHEAEAAFRRATLSRAADLEPFLSRMRQLKLAALGR